MCTLTLHKPADTLTITMNRDEYRERHETEVFSGKRDGIDIRHPTDGQAGGTWCGINSHGVVLCLLNKYEVATVSDATSRGTIIPKALACGSIETTIDFMRALKTDAFNGFDCVLTNHHRGIVFSWDRERYKEQDLSFSQSLMFTSSSERLGEVSNYRKQLFSAWQQHSHKMDSSHFHLGQAEARAADAVFMRREPTHTKSVVRFELSPSSASFRYYDETQLRLNTSLSSLQPSYCWTSNT